MPLRRGPDGRWEKRVMGEAGGAFTGGCFCGKVRYAVTGAPDWVAYCHCESCRRQVAAPVAPYLGVKRSQVAFSGGAPKTHRSSPGVTRSFCGDCGTPIAYESERRPDDIDLHLGTLDQPERFAPTAHVFAAERLPWFDTRDELPRHAAGGSDSDGGDA